MSLPPRSIVYSSLHSATLEDYPIPDIDRENGFAPVFLAARDYTMTSKDTMFALYKAVEYVARRKLPGAFVECGVWRGGSSLLAALTFAALGDTARPFYLFDTYEGMTAPTELDVDREGGSAAEYMARYSDDGGWCYASLDDVAANFAKHGMAGDRGFTRSHSPEIMDPFSATIRCGDNGIHFPHPIV